MNGIAGRRFLVCGGGSGLGEATARRLHGDGAVVVIADRDLTGASRVAVSLGGCTVLHYEQDDPLSVADLFTAVADTGDLHGVAIVAGVHPGHAPLGETSDARLRAVHAVNVSGVLSCLREAARVLVDDGRSSIVVVGSVAGIRPVAQDAVYASSKAAAQVMARSAALELAPRIRVNSVLPGVAITPLAVSQSSSALIEQQAERVIPMRRAAHADEVAAAITFLLSDDASYITATELVVDGGLAANGPT